MGQDLHPFGMQPGRVDPHPDATRDEQDEGDDDGCNMDVLEEAVVDHGWFDLVGFIEVGMRGLFRWPGYFNWIAASPRSSR